MNMVTQETKQSVGQTTLPVRGRLQRPRPNVQKARQRQTVEKGEADGVAKSEGSELQKDETRKVLTVVRGLILSTCNKRQLSPALSSHLVFSNEEFCGFPLVPQ